MTDRETDAQREREDRIEANTTGSKYQQNLSETGWYKMETE